MPLEKESATDLHKPGAPCIEMEIVSHHNICTPGQLTDIKPTSHLGPKGNVINRIMY